MTEQEQLFKEWLYVCESLSNLKSFVQNDFDSMIKDGYITKEQIRASIEDFRKKQANVINDILLTSKKIEGLLFKKSEP